MTIRCFFIFVTALLLGLGFTPVLLQAESGLLNFGPGDVFSGEEKRGNRACRIELVLEARRSFVLTEMWIAQGKKRKKTVTGSWHPLSGGKRLQLTNRHGYYLVLTVGSDNLYFERPRAPFDYTTLVLRPAQGGREVCRPISGLLDIKGEIPLLHDAATGLDYELHGLSSEALPEACRQNGECLARGTGCGLNDGDERPLRLREIAMECVRHPLPRVWRSTPEAFGLRVADVDWLLVSPEPVDGQVYLRFQSERPGGGKVLLRGFGLSYAFAFSLTGDRLSLVSDEKKKTPPELAGAFISPLAWSVDGERLELQVPGGDIFVWEKAATTE